jgi:SNF2 family DNA or RNA helicase
MSSVPEQLRSSLFNFQKEAVIFGIKRYGRFLLGDEMGVGKTIQAIAVSCVYKEDWPLLIVCPSSLVSLRLSYIHLAFYMAGRDHKMAGPMVAEGA